MELKYVVVHLNGELVFEILFEFRQPEPALDVCQQLRDRYNYNRYEVVVRYA